MRTVVKNFELFVWPCYDVVKLSVSEVVLESKIYLLKMSVHFDIERACDE